MSQLYCQVVSPKWPKKKLCSPNFAESLWLIFFATKNYDPKNLHFWVVLEGENCGLFQWNPGSPRIMGSQSWWFGDPRTLLYRVNPLHRRVQWFLGLGEILYFCYPRWESRNSLGIWCERQGVRWSQLDIERCQFFQRNKFANGENKQRTHQFFLIKSRSRWWIKSMVMWVVPEVYPMKWLVPGDFLGGDAERKVNKICEKPSTCGARCWKVI